jgi:hypothetical protein
MVDVMGEDQVVGGAGVVRNLVKGQQSDKKTRDRIPFDIIVENAEEATVLRRSKRACTAPQA